MRESYLVTERILRLTNRERFTFDIYMSEFETSRSTFMRDIKFLKERCYMFCDVVYDTELKCWRVTKK